MPRPFHQPAARILGAIVVLVALVCACAGASATPAPRTSGVGLSGVRFGGDATATRVVLDLDAAVSGSLVAGESAPGRLAIALPPLLSSGPLQGSGKGLVSAWSVRDDAAGAVLTLEATPGTTVARRFLIPPDGEGGHWRYVIDLRGSAGDPLAALVDHGAPRLAGAAPPAPSAIQAAPTAAEAVAPVPASAPTPPPQKLAAQTLWSPPPYMAVATATAPVLAPAAVPVAIPVAAALAPRPPAAPPRRPAGVAAVRTAPVRPGGERGLKVVVIDAGHGGHDTGARSLVRNEKDLTLAAALSLRAHLLRMGRYKVVMTRDSDVFIPLGDRVQVARRAGADLFISLHADSAGSDPTPHGASVYTLSDSGETRVNYVLGPHEWFSRVGDGRADVRQILLDLTQRSTRNRSSEFAAKLLGHIGDKVDLLPRSHRDAGYFVLLAPDVPAVLLEMGFITNPGDEMRLTDPAQRDRLAAGIADAIDDYFYGATRLTAGF